MFDNPRQIDIFYVIMLYVERCWKNQFREF